MDQSNVYGVIGGGNGLGRWFVDFFAKSGYKVFYSDLVKPEADQQAIFIQSNKELVEEVDVVILAVPISKICEVMSEVYPNLRNKILFEICSVKQFVIECFLELEVQYGFSPEFHSLHPMFGPETATLQEQVFTLTYTNKVNSRILILFKEFVSDQGAKWHEIDYLEHDRIMAIIQSLNHFNMFVSAKTVKELGFNFNLHKGFSSPTYRIFIILYTRYVSQNAKLYFEIQRYNRFSKRVIRAFKTEIDRLFEIVQLDSEEEFVKYVDEMKPYFEANKEDYSLSQRLIESLGDLLK